MGERLSGEDLDRLRRAAQEVGAQRTIIGRLKVEHDIYDVIAVAHSPWGENVGLEEARAAYIAAACPETVLRLVDEVQEAREDEGVYRVWRRRCMEAETRIEELEAQVAHLNKACDRWKIDAHRAESELAAAHESAQGCAEELTRVADELRAMKRRCSVPHTWELTTDGKRCLVCGRREEFIEGNAPGDVDS